MSKYLKGQICLTDIPKELIRSVQCKDGAVKQYLDVLISERRSPVVFQRSWGEQRITHNIQCAVKKANRKEGVNYYIGDLELRDSDNNGFAQQAAPQPTAQQSWNPPAGNFYSAGEGQGLPF